MRGKSHLCLGEYLTHHYMENLPKRYKRAFLIGCIEPDRNPMTYFKGSLHFQWLRGHNYHNANRYMEKLSYRLEHKKKLHLLDYYSAGKLIHYTTDAFTYAHNDLFPTDLSVHKTYEAALQDHFLDFMTHDPKGDAAPMRSVMSTIRTHHKDYIGRPGDIHTDTRFAFSVCCSVMSILLFKKFPTVM